MGDFSTPAKINNLSGGIFYPVKFLYLYVVFRTLFTVFFLLPCCVGAQGIYTRGKFQFTAYEKIPAWACVTSGWESQNPVIHLYDHTKYKGHADFVSFGLKTGITFAQFKEQVKHFSTRKYLPFFLYDLRRDPYHQNNVAYKWAIRLEDYSYDDNPAQMTGTVIKLYNAVENYIAKETGKRSKGVVILAVSEKVHPNTGIKKSLNNSGISTILLKELLSHAGTAKTIILNEGRAIGQLKYVKASENETALLSPHDIVIFEKAPLRIPPVAGIITLEPQTPLSHVNLLAKNRKTLNICTDNLKSIPELEKHIGKYIKITGYKGEINLSEISKKKFEEDEKAITHIELVIPAAHFDFDSIVDLQNNPGKATVNFVGAKAANFARIQKAFPAYTTKGFAIPFSFYTNHLHRAGAGEIIDSLRLYQNNLDPLRIDKILVRLRKKIMDTSLDTLLVSEVQQVQKKQFDGKKIRLRSSTNCEDLPNFNGAGLYLSNGYSKKESKKKLEEKIKEVYASMWTSFAFKERAFYGIKHKEAAMAILISEAYENELANGVVLTIPGQNNVAVYINAQPGGHLVTNPQGAEIPEALFFNSSADTTYEIRSHSSFGDVFLKKENESLLQELKTLSADIHNVLTKGKNKYGTDIEFKIISCCGENKLVVKQARLIYDATPY
ncbi:MAG TPA: PEP/pyruvate-binding domain-containing protein [Flavobacteriales bacterium]|nr:PEP/pyruvate-binding domain-containing protein [Flavobacteriales bacterium]